MPSTYRSIRIKFVVVVLVMIIVLCCRRFTEEINVEESYSNAPVGDLNQTNHRDIINLNRKQHDLYPQIFVEPIVACSRSNTVIVYVLSTINGYERRDVIRATWGNVSLWNKMAMNPFHVELFFVIGTSCNVNKSRLHYLASLDDENRYYGDLLVGDVTDCYSNLTNKGIVTLRWINDNCDVNNIAFVFKTDDDVFINMPLMISRMKQSQLSSKNCHFLCNFLQKVRVPREGKWAITRDIYGEDIFPGYCQGMGYALCPRGLALLKQHFPKVQPAPFPLEDTFITALALRAHIGDTGLGDLKYERIKHPTVSQNLDHLKADAMHAYIMMHQIPMEVYQELHEAIMTGLTNKKIMIDELQDVYKTVAILRKATRH